MAETKHTPGPWSARKAPHGPIDILAADGRDIVTLYGGGVDEAPADNARLIAAAPEMLDALKAVLEEKAPSYHDCTDDGLPKCAWCLADEAIAKAEGRTP